MALSSTFRRVIVGVAAIAFFLISSAELRAQVTNPFKRGVCIEEFTGTWCGYCPRGAWFMDSLQVYMGDNAVEICWHNNNSQPGIDDPNYGGDPFTIDLDQDNKVEDTVEAYFGVPGFPSVGIMRNAAGDVNDWSAGDPVYSALKKAAQQTPLADFRIVNVAYNPSNNTLNADMDVTPYDLSVMPSEDLMKYMTIAVVTEDNLEADQHNYNLRGLGDWLSPFVHQNVARQVGGKVTGNQFTLGTKAASPSFPVRIHYSFNLNSAWVASNLRLKGIFDGIKDTTIAKKQYQMNNVYNAAQTKYFNSYPQTPADAAWIVLPNGNSSVKPNVPTNIVWATGGSVGNNVKLEYSIDNGTTWNLIIASTTQSPYPWTVPPAAYGGMAMVRVSANGVSGNSEAFKTPGKITISKPAAGEVINGGTSDYMITYTGGNLKSLIKYEYSTDNGTTWSLIGNLGNVDATTFDWSLVPNPAADAPQSMVRITDANGVVGTSALFTIKSIANIGTLSNVQVAGLDHSTVPNIASNKATTVTWSSNGGVLGSKLIVEYTVDNTITWQTISNSVDPTATSVNWTTPSSYYANGCFVRVRSADNDKANITSQSSEFSIGTQTTQGVSQNSMNGYTLSNYPNPFNGETTIKFELPVSTSVTLSVRDELGREVSHIVTENLDAGSHSMPFSALKLSNGVYNYTLEAGATKLVGKMTVVK